MHQRFLSGWLLLAALFFPALGLAEVPFQDQPVEIRSTVGAPEPETVASPEPEKRSFLGGLFDKGKSLLDKAKDKAKGWLESARHIFELVKENAPKVLNLPGWYRQGHLSARKREELMRLARAHPERAWPAGRDIATARNAHRTTTYGEFKEALEGDYDYLEADLRLEGPLRDHLSLPGPARRPVVAHDSFQTNGILFEDWIQIAKASGKGIKIDFKAGEAIEPVIEILKNAGISQDRLIMNIGIPNPGPISLDELNNPLRNQPVHDQRLKNIRAAFPRCILNLSPGGAPDAKGHYTQRAVEQMIRYAKAAGQPVMFPLRAEMVTPEIVQALKPFGKVAIWNSPNTFNPRDKEAEIKKFRSWGVDGMIDIMTRPDFPEK